MRLSIPALHVTLYHCGNKVISSRCQRSCSITTLFELLGLRQKRIIALRNGCGWLGGGGFGGAFGGGAAVGRGDVDVF